MGLTASSTGMNALDSGLEIKKRTPKDKVVAIAGNPNVGKSTLFNSLTGSSQHTGNWPGKTVSNAQGCCETASHSYVFVDIPGTYSLMAHSAEEEVARNFICFGERDAVVVVCDATCLERNLNLVLQTMEISQNTMICVNLLDEAKRKHISIDLEKLSNLLKAPVAGTIARKKKTLHHMMTELDHLMDSPKGSYFHVEYCPALEEAIALSQPAIERCLSSASLRRCLNPRWLALKLLEGDPSLLLELEHFLGKDILKDEAVAEGLSKARAFLEDQGIFREQLKDRIVQGLVACAERLAKETVHFHEPGYNERDRKLDQILTSRLTGYPIMAGLLALVFWLTITGANYPSQLLSHFLFGIQDWLTKCFQAAGAPEWLHGMLVLGVYRVLAWVVSVMLPPMAIFFPLFTLLEDSGYLPRIAFNLDKPFQRCHACGKQALSMCMGFGCNAAGIVGCRIIDSPRERLIAMITNSFVPCNGRFPTLIAIISMFFVGTAGGLLPSVLSTLILTAFILLGIAMTFLVSRLLSLTVLKGIPSSFTLELPPYRRPQIGKVIVRSIFDRTLFVLGRAASIAAPAGLLIWLMANVTAGNMTLLAHCAAFLDPFGKLIGLDGVILMAFIPGLPANEIVLPIIIMAYMAQGTIVEFDSLTELKALLTANGWTWLTAVNTMLFSLMHWPCSTTLMTIHKETGSFKWTAISLLVPAACGIVLCMGVAAAARTLGF